MRSLARQIIPKKKEIVHEPEIVTSRSATESSGAPNCILSRPRSAKSIVCSTIFAPGFAAFGSAAADLAPTMDVAGKSTLPTMFSRSAAKNRLTSRTRTILERSYGAFSRTVELPDGANPDVIRATINKGVLEVTVPKPASAQVKKIEVKAAA